MAIIAKINLTKEDRDELVKRINPWGSDISDYSGLHKLQGYWVRQNILNENISHEEPATIWNMYRDTGEFIQLDVPDFTGDLEGFIKLYKENKGR